MNYIKNIMISDKLGNYSFKKNNYDSRLLEELSKLNIFIGGNNSGKSRLLRGIYTDNRLRINVNTKCLKDINNIIKNLNDDIEKAVQECKHTGNKGNLKTNDKNIYFYKGYPKEIEYLQENNSEIREMLLREIQWLEQCKDSVSIGEYAYESSSGLPEKFNAIGSSYKNRYYDDINTILVDKKYKRIYIPTLRGLRKLADKDVLHNRTIVDYFDENKEIEVFTGQSLYEDVLDLLCGDFKDRIHLREFETLLGNNFFDGKEISLIPKRNSDVLYVKIGQEKEQPIYNLGDGIQSIIILTFNLFKNKGQDVLFFIEEPELYLHPGLQRKVLEIFLDNEFDTYQYFITSHSNHLLDLTLDIDNISVYRFNKEIEKDDGNEKDAKFNIENVKNDDSTVLQLLGVNNSSIFLSNCTIWVEGITDRLYLRKYLEVYQKDIIKNKKNKRMYVEDIHYSFLEYSGGNITHWDFLNDDNECEEIEKAIKHDRICNKIFLIADSDGAQEGTKKYERQQKLKKFFEDKFYCLTAKEIENILTPNVIKAIVNDFIDLRVKEGNDLDGELFSECEFEQREYNNSNLGEFIESKIDERIKEKEELDTKFKYKRRKNYKSNNTICNKVQFCKYALNNIKTIEDMSEEAIDLCEKIYNFISSTNI